MMTSRRKGRSETFTLRDIGAEGARSGGLDRFATGTAEKFARENERFRKGLRDKNTAGSAPASRAAQSRNRISETSQRRRGRFDNARSSRAGAPATVTTRPQQQPRSAADGRRSSTGAATRDANAKRGERSDGWTGNSAR